MPKQITPLKAIQDLPLPAEIRERVLAVAEGLTEEEQMALYTELSDRLLQAFDEGEKKIAEVEHVLSKANKGVAAFEEAAEHTTDLKKIEDDFQQNI